MSNFERINRNNVSPLIFRMSLAALVAGVIALTSCEPHSASETVPGWDKKQAEKQEKAKLDEQAQKVDPNAPSYFPRKGE